MVADVVSELVVVSETTELNVVDNGLDDARTVGEEVVELAEMGVELVEMGVEGKGVELIEMGVDVNPEELGLVVMEVLMTTKSRKNRPSSTKLSIVIV